MQTTRIISALGIFLLAILSMGAPALGANQNVQRTDVTLTPSLFAPTNAIGDATYTLRRHRADFEVDVEDLEPGVYDVFVGGVPRVQVLVSAIPGGTQGKIELSTFPLPGQLSLFFDPRGQAIDVRLGSTLLFSGILPAPGNPEGSGDGAMFNKVSEKITLDTMDASRAKGKLQIKSNKRQAQLMLSLQRLDQGQYTITANDVAIADFTTNKKGAAKIRFRTTPKPSDLLLDFDPASTTFRIMRGETVVLRGTSNALSIGGGASPIGTLDRAFNNTGAAPGASGDAVFQDRVNSLDFLVSVTDLPVGSYDLIVEGTAVGTIGVVSDTQGGSAGSIEFSTDPSSASVYILDFDPRGQTVQITQGETIFLSVTFPN